MSDPRASNPRVSDSRVSDSRVSDPRVISANGGRGSSAEAIAEALEDHAFDAHVLSRLVRYADLLLEANATMNLTAARTPAEVAAHIADSLSLLPFVRSPLVDVGSGGGFPAVPLAIVAGLDVTLVESVVKKARFLESLALALRLPARVRAQRAEEAARDPELRERFASATARAVAGVATVLELTVPFLTVGGVAVLQRGRFDAGERSVAADAALVLGATLTSDLAAGGDDDGRRIVLATKERRTGQRFPRRAGVPAKRPLCATGSPADV